MPAFPAPTRNDHRSFCEIDGWTLVRDAKGKNVNHHLTYELGLPDGRILRTRISQPPDKTTYGRRLWGHILRDQLDVSQEDFWACVQNGARPLRGTEPPPQQTVPTELFQLLVTRAGIAEARVLSMTKEEAIAAAVAYWSRATPETNGAQ